MVLRLSLAANLSLLLLGASGCRGTATLLGAIVCQGIADPVISDSADNMAFRGLDAGTRPRIRPGSYASSTAGVHFLDPGDLGSHGYRYSWSEKNGIVYACGAGHVDIAHVRKAADWTGFLAATTFESLKREEIEFSFKLREPSRYFVKLTYPENWERLAPKDKERIAHHVSIELGQYFAYVAATWHEILTWFGYRPKAFQSEFPSAFSWEDVFSNLLGTHIAVLALEDAEHDFSESVTLALDRELKNLGAQPAQTARRAAEKVRGLWFSRPLFFTIMQRRNFDVGLNDGLVTPWLVPSLPECQGAQAQPLPIPKLDLLHEHGFSMKLEIEPREWEKDKILRIVLPDAKKRGKRLEPAVDFPRIMDYIKKDAVRRYGPDVDDAG
jgi:hypothetical protein